MKKKLYLYTFLSWVFSIKLFFLTSFYKEYWTIYKYSLSFSDFIYEIILFKINLFKTIYFSTLSLSIVFALLLFYFYYTYFLIYLFKFDKNYKIKNKKYGVFGIVFTYLGFGCVACGQTLLYSFLLLFSSSVSLYLAPIVGQLSLLLGCIFLIFGIYKNNKIINSGNICKF